ncbi:MAG: hypothetical protein ABR551_00560 [Gemmatimonadales bacterium]
MKRALLGRLTAAVLATLGLAFGPADAEAQRRDRDLITREELVQSSQKSTDLYQAVRSLRSHFLQGPRGPRSINADPARTGSGSAGTLRATEAPKAVLYVNGSRSGDVEMLRNIQTINVEEVRYVNPNAASMQYGTGHEGGAILVKLVAGPTGGGA